MQGFILSTLKKTKESIQETVSLSQTVGINLPLVEYFSLRITLFQFCVAQGNNNFQVSNLHTENGKLFQHGCQRHKPKQTSSRHFNPRTRFLTCKCSTQTLFLLFICKDRCAKKM